MELAAFEGAASGGGCEDDDEHVFRKSVARFTMWFNITMDLKTAMTKGVNRLIAFMQRTQDGHEQALYYVAYRHAMCMKYKCVLAPEVDVELLRRVVKKANAFRLTDALWDESLLALLVSLNQRVFASSSIQLCVYIHQVTTRSDIDLFMFKLYAIRYVATLGCESDEWLLQRTLNCMHAAKILSDPPAATMPLKVKDCDILKCARFVCGSAHVDALRYEGRTGVPMYMPDALAIAKNDNITPAMWYLIVTHYGACECTMMHK